MIRQLSHHYSSGWCFFVGRSLMSRGRTFNCNYVKLLINDQIGCVLAIQSLTHAGQDNRIVRSCGCHRRQTGEGDALYGRYRALLRDSHSESAEAHGGAAGERASWGSVSFRAESFLVSVLVLVLLFCREWETVYSFVVQCNGMPKWAHSNQNMASENRFLVTQTHTMAHWMAESIM